MDFSIGGEKIFGRRKKTRVLWQKPAQFFFRAYKCLLMGARDVVLAETENAICGVWQYYSHNQAGYSLNFSSLFLFTK
ncbi:MAG: hypothetical protein VZQ99_04940, partial [Treponema sp.]|nr:hypothetical protein [Treponema sp.]